MTGGPRRPCFGERPIVLIAHRGGMFSASVIEVAPIVLGCRLVSSCSLHGTDFAHATLLGRIRSRSGSGSRSSRRHTRTTTRDSWREQHDVAGSAVTAT